MPVTQPEVGPVLGIYVNNAEGFLVVCPTLSRVEACIMHLFHADNVVTL